ncbi:DUF4124 domain-containing protein [Diaphorobacter aerolatus]|uniref:DUF4124 domain-containing protein n=1 Tax=Diaphorobacter aerolatus TaxID=1288495 RepID=A0A7H0GJU0_9BURK|nr:DUF4124 domain-containing protein [Diaphorobacter aerolatus]QNP48556.1 DUF4124 domain-containing protein [Diaphorobacter aerolatus]
MKPYKLLLLTIACTWALGASAQWQWLDKDGRKVYSDRPPPVEVPQKNILKQPGSGRSSSTPAPVQQQQQPDAATPASAPVASASAPGLPQPSGTDKKLEEAKAKQEAEEAAKKKAEADRVAKAKAENCARAKKSKESLNSGGLIGHVNEKGERGFMDEATREAELKRADSVIASDCGK